MRADLAAGGADRLPGLRRGAAGGATPTGVRRGALGVGLELKRLGVVLMFSFGEIGQGQKRTPFGGGGGAGKVQMAAGFPPQARVEGGFAQRKLGFRVLIGGPEEFFRLPVTPERVGRGEQERQEIRVRVLAPVLFGPGAGFVGAAFGLQQPGFGEQGGLELLIGAQSVIDRDQGRAGRARRLMGLGFGEGGNGLAMVTLGRGEGIAAKL